MNRRTLRCPTCLAYVEDWGAKGLRCPWTSAARSHAGDIAGIPALTCGWPYTDGRDEPEGPLGARTGMR